MSRKLRLVKLDTVCAEKEIVWMTVMHVQVRR